MIAKITALITSTWTNRSLIAAACGDAGSKTGNAEVVDASDMGRGAL
jgi:hypothetical protein